MFIKCVLYLIILTGYVKATCGRYRIPTPTITVYQPRGLQITIPHKLGIEIVVFYVNINKQLIGVEPSYTEIVIRETEGQWTFNNTAIELKEGDTLYYKVFVQKQRRGYLYNGAPYIVKELRQHHDTHQRPHTVDESCDDSISQDTGDSFEQSVTSKPGIATITNSSSSITPAPENCSTAIHIVVSLLAQYNTELVNARSDLELLKELVSTQPLNLRLTGTVIHAGEPKEVIDFLLFDKLYTNQKVKRAWKDGASVVFELYTLEQKLDILKRARKYLKNSQNMMITN